MFIACLVIPGCLGRSDVYKKLSKHVKREVVFSISHVSSVLFALIQVDFYEGKKASHMTEK